MKEENGKLYYEVGDKLYRPVKSVSTANGIQIQGYSIDELVVTAIEDGVVYLDNNGREERTGLEYSKAMGNLTRE